MGNDLVCGILDWNTSPSPEPNPPIPVATGTLTPKHPHTSILYSRGPKMTAFHTMILSWHGEPEIPSGASVARRLKSRMSLRLAAVDWECQCIVGMERWASRRDK